jgi:hypothetical protein
VNEQTKEHLKSIVEENGLQETIQGLVGICQIKAMPKSQSEFDKDVAARFGRALVLLSELQLKLDTPPYEM